MRLALFLVWVTVYRCDTFELVIEIVVRSFVFQPRDESEHRQAHRLLPTTSFLLLRLRVLVIIFLDVFFNEFVIVVASIFFRLVVGMFPAYISITPTQSIQPTKTAMQTDNLALYLPPSLPPPPPPNPPLFLHTQNNSHNVLLKYRCNTTQELTTSHHMMHNMTAAYTTTHASTSLH